MTLLWSESQQANLQPRIRKWGNPPQDQLPLLMHYHSKRRWTWVRRITTSPCHNHNHHHPIPHPTLLPSLLLHCLGLIWSGANGPPMVSLYLSTSGLVLWSIFTFFFTLLLYSDCMMQSQRGVCNRFHLYLFIPQCRPYLVHDWYYISRTSYTTTIPLALPFGQALGVCSE